MRTSWVEGNVYILQNSSTTHLTFMNFIGCKSHLNLNKECYEKKGEIPPKMWGYDRAENYFSRT